MLVRGASGGFWLLLHGSGNENSLLEALHSQLITNKCVFLTVRSLPADSGLHALFAQTAVSRIELTLTAVSSSCQDSPSNCGCHSNYSRSFKSTDAVFTFLDLYLLNLLKCTRSEETEQYIPFILWTTHLLSGDWTKKWIEQTNPLAGLRLEAVLRQHVIFVSFEL